jgi:hypothetical protein
LKYHKNCEATNMDMQDAMLIQQLRQKQQLKQECLHADDSTPLHKESDKLLALSQMASDEEQHLTFAAQLKKEQRYLESLLEEMRTSYDEMPPAMQESAVGKQAKTSVMLTAAALHRLQQAETADRKDLPMLLEESAFLLDGADGRT